MRDFSARHPKLAGFAAEVGKFGSVGAAAYVVQLGATNLLWGAAGMAPMSGQVVGTLCSIAVAFVGNRFWTFSDRARTGYGRETVLFLVMNGVGMLIQLGCLGFSVYVLGFEGQLAQNVAGNVVGVGLGTLFRFFSYRTWVFPPPREDDAAVAATTDATAGTVTNSANASKAADTTDTAEDVPDASDVPGAVTEPG